MFCKKCGSSLRDNAKFCGSCGAVVEVADAQGNNVSYTTPVQKAPTYTTPVQKAPTYTAPVQKAPAHTAPVQKPKADKTAPIKKVTGAFTKAASKVDVSGIVNKVPKKSLPIIGGAAVVVLVLILLFTGVFGGGNAVVKAFNKSLGAYVSIADEMKLPDMAAIAESGKYNQELKLWISDGADEVEGLGVRFQFAYNQSGEEAALIAAPYFEGTDLITAQMKLKGSKIYVGCPELMDKTYVMLDTMTIGEDLADKDVDGMDDLSFNVFTLIDQIQKTSELTKDQEKALEKGTTAFIKAIEVEKDGKSDIKVNGKKLSCTVYNVVIPQDAMEDYLDVLEDVLKDMDTDAVADILEDAGIPVDDMGLDFSNDDALDMIDEMKDFVDELGDFEAEVGINKGYVVSVKSEFELWSEEYVIDIQLGGGDNYVDDIYFELLSESEYGYIVTSSGNHAMKKGVFTDETVVTRVYNGNERDILNSELSWEPKAKADNFELAMDFDGDEIVMEGTLTCTKNSLTMELPEFEVDGVTLGIGYSISDYKAPSIKVGTTMAFADMDESDMEDLVEMIEENGEAWAEMMEDDYGDLFEYIGNMLYYMF